MDTDVGKVFAVVFALVGIPLMFITAADIGKFLSETLLKFVSNWNRMIRRIKVGSLIESVLQQVCCRNRYTRRKSMQSSNGNTDTMEILGIDGAEEKLWFPIGSLRWAGNSIPRRICGLHLSVLLNGLCNVHQLGEELVLHPRLPLWFQSHCDRRPWRHRRQGLHLPLAHRRLRYRR